MLTQEEYAILRAKYDTYHAAREAQYPKQNAFTPEMLATLPPVTTNDETSAIEVFEFMRDKPDRYVAYVSSDAKSVTTWTGDHLGTLRMSGSMYRSNMGDKRTPITVKAINGRTYYGRSQGSGMCVSLRAYKGA